MTFKLATWNINSVRSRIGHIKRFVETFDPDILCLQETKCADENFPISALQALGFIHIELKGQKAYHGVATLSRLPIERVETRDFNGTGEARHLSVRIGGNRPDAPVLHNVYVPAGGDIPDEAANPKFAQKLSFLRAMEDWGKSQAGNGRAGSILVGDLNVAPLESDVWSHKQLLRVVSHTPIEVEHFEAARRSHGWVDVMREHIPPDEPLFTWWSYRARNWRQSNRGRRLDHVWTSPGLSSSAVSLRVIDEARDWDRPSDHAPVVVDFELSS